MIGWCFSISQSQPCFLLKAFSSKPFSVSNVGPRLMEGLLCLSIAMSNRNSIFWYMLWYVLLSFNLNTKPTCAMCFSCVFWHVDREYIAIKIHIYHLIGVPTKSVCTINTPLACKDVHIFNLEQFPSFSFLQLLRVSQCNRVMWSIRYCYWKYLLTSILLVSL